MSLFVEIARDFRLGLWTLRKAPVFATVSVLSLAIGAGAVSAIVSLADALLLRPLPVPRARELTTLATSTLQTRVGALSYPEYIDFRDRMRSVSALAAYAVLPMSVADSSKAAPQVTTGAVASGNFFRVLEVEPRLGRSFTEEEDRVPGRDAVAVLSDAFWAQRFARDPAAIGRALRLNGVEFRVIGVAPASFSDLGLGVQPAVFVPIAMWSRVAPGLAADPFVSRDARALIVKGRLVAGVSIQQASSEAAALARALEAEYPQTNRGVGAAVLSELQARLQSSPAQATLVPLLGVLAMTVLLVACANVAGLQISRAQTRRRELAVRLALGASRLRVVRQLLAESVLIAGAGCGLGLLVASWMLVFLRRIQVPTDPPVGLSVQLDARIVAISLTVAGLSAMAFGLTPALNSLRVNLVGDLKLGAAGPPQRSRLAFRNVLVAVQVTASFIVLTIAAVVYLGFRTPLSASPGFRTDGLLLATIDPTLTGMTRDRIVPFYRALEERMRAIGGVARVAFVSDVPMRFGQRSIEILPGGYVPADPRERVTVGASVTTTDYFDVLGIPILRGRAFQQTDGPESAPVAIVNEAFARKYFPDGQVLGRRVLLVDGSNRSVEVVGIARQSKYGWIAEPPTEFLYLPFLQQPQGRMSVVLETRGEPATFAAQVRDAVRDLDPDQATSAVMTMRDFYRRQVVGVPTTLIQTIGALGAIGLALAMVGLYGLVSYLVGIRTREIGVRMALGASRRQILLATVREAALLSIAGVIVGAIGALVARQALLAAFSTGTDLPAYLLLPVVVLIVTVTSAWVPARRAASVDPSLVLRNE